MKIKEITLIAVLIFLVSCGGGSSGSSTVGEEGNGEPVAMDISASGGSVELPGVAMVEFPAGAFEKNANVSVQETVVDDRIDELINTLPSTPFVGQPYGKTLTILSPNQPLQDIVVRYTVPEDFLQQLDSQSEPILVANYVQGGDEEKLDDFENMQATLSDNILTTKLPPWVFSNDYPDTNGAFRTIILLGTKTKDDSGSDSYKSFFLKSGDTCNGSLIGSPLEGELEVTSAFGPRAHPITNVRKDHSGTDFRTKTGVNVFAAADGTIEKISYDYNPASKTGYGYYVILLHQDGSKTRYAHLEEGSTDSLHVGDEVKQGDVIAKADTSGGATGPHLHFEYEFGGERIDPQPCFQSSPIEIEEVVYGDKIVVKQLKTFIQFEIHLKIPAGNNISSIACVGIEDSTGTCQHLTQMDFVTVDGVVEFKVPRGSWSGNVSIVDGFQNKVVAPINVSWDCCDIPNQSNMPIYSGDGKLIDKVPYHCFFLGDKTNQCK